MDRIIAQFSKNQSRFLKLHGTFIYLLGIMCIYFLKQGSQLFFPHYTISEKCNKFLPGDFSIIWKQQWTMTTQIATFQIICMFSIPIPERGNAGKHNGFNIRTGGSLEKLSPVHYLAADGR